MQDLNIQLMERDMILRCTLFILPQRLNDIGYAAMGIMFSVEDYTSDLTWAEQKLVDTFFDSMGW